MTMTSSNPLRALLVCLAAGSALALGACTDDGPASDKGDETESGDGDGEGDDATGDGDGDEAESGDGDGDPGDGDGDKPGLGDTPNVLCEAATVNLAAIVAENQSGSPDPLAVEAAYVDTGLQEFVQLAGAVTGRIEAGVLLDDAAILASIDAGGPLDLIDVEWRVYLAMQQYIRHEIADVAAMVPDPANDPALLYGRWDAAYCYWDGALRPLAQIADGIGLPGDSIEADIDAGFLRGHEGIEGEQPWAIDPWELGPAKQIVEKSTFTVAHRLVMLWSQDAASSNSAELAHAAYGAFQMIEDRMAGRNTPAIATIEAALLGDPSAIDPERILRDMNIAFAKRTRKYTDYALPEIGDLMGTPEGSIGANEGSIYSKLIEPFMLELDGFDHDGYRQAWADWIDAVVNDDVAAGELAAAVLVDWNCQFQDALGIAECTDSKDEE
ncbi:MAG: hypothetical protein R6X02_12875 [Enhygromyxa sp.]